MWKIKDPELKAKVNQFFTDKEIHEEFEKNTDLYNYFRLSTVNKKGLCVTITVEKELVEFVPEYQENDWNPYPTYSWEDHDDRLIVAFRSLPAPYQPGETK